jgi:hypothetical protein
MIQAGTGVNQWGGGRLVDVPEDLLNLRIRLTSELSKKFGKVLTKKGTAKQHAIVKIVEWFCEQDDKVQSLVLGQLDPDPAILLLILRKFGLPEIPVDEGEGDPLKQRPQQAASVRSRGSQAPDRAAERTASR